MSGDPDDRDPSARFVRGLTLGALLGAVIAGSSIWSRARARRAAGHDDPGPASMPRTPEQNAAADPDRPAEANA